jgi:hypothetical protein
MIPIHYALILCVSSKDTQKRFILWRYILKFGLSGLVGLKTESHNFSVINYFVFFNLKRLCIKIKTSNLNLCYVYIHQNIHSDNDL